MTTTVAYGLLNGEGGGGGGMVQLSQCAW